MKPLLLLIATAFPAAAGIVSIAHPAMPLPEGETCVWSVLFQAGWDRLNETHGGKPVAVEPPNVLISQLDGFAWDRDSTLPPGGWKCWAGPADDAFLRTVNAEAAALTGEAAGPFRLEDPLPGTLAVFALLNREVEFQHALQPSKKIPMIFRHGSVASPVPFFRIRGKESGETGNAIRVLGYRPSENAHAVQMRCRDADDTVVLFRPPAPMSFDSACRWIRAWRKAAAESPGGKGAIDDPYLHAHDLIRVPYVSLSAVHDFASELASARTYEGHPMPRIVRRAEQVTRFELHEGGARVRVEVSMADDPFASTSSGPKVYPRHFHYDAPFFAFLWRDLAEWPYFGVWLGDATALKAAP